MTVKKEVKKQNEESEEIQKDDQNETGRSES